MADGLWTVPPCGQPAAAHTPWTTLRVVHTAHSPDDGWSCFRQTNGPIFDCQSSGEMTKVALFSANKWSCFRLTRTTWAKPCEPPEEYIPSF